MLPANTLALALALLPLVAAAAPTAAPSPVASPTPRDLKTIVTVLSTPYCNALAEHFNGALLPMLANDRVFNSVSVQLDDMNQMFNYPDYVNRFLTLRKQTVAESDTLIRSLKPMQRQIDALRQGATLATDPAAAQQMRDAATHLQDAYNHQFQLSTDLTSLAQSMMEYDIERGPHPLGGWTPAEQTMPADEKNIKVYLHFDRQRTSIGDAEDRAVDVAYTIAQTHCTKSP
ncbi:MAG TPA: hypothetical protein VGF86_03575 [Candidatus Tumulicola sp.]|jgi:hypothetical protein